jgi:hypothetical protein
MANLHRVLIHRRRQPSQPDAVTVTATRPGDHAARGHGKEYSRVPGSAITSAGRAVRAAVTGRKGPEYRFRRGTLQTPLLTYARGRQTVTVISVFYIGTPAYYAAVHDRAAALESAGARVQYELIPDAPPGQWADAASRRHDSPFRVAAMMDAATRYLRLTSRQDGLRYEPAWAAVDTAPGAWPRRQERVGPFQIHHSPGLDIALLSLRITGEKWNRILLDDYPRAQARIGERALAALPPGRDAVLIWSSAHFPGLAARLEKAGYQRNDLCWLPAGKFPGLVKSYITFFTESFRLPPYPAYRLPAPHGPAARPSPPAGQPGQGQDRAPLRDPAGAPAPRRRVVMNGRSYRMTSTLRAVLAVVVDPGPAGPAWGPAICERTGLGPRAVYRALDKLLKTTLIRDEQETAPPAGRAPGRYYFPAYEPAWYRANCLLPEPPGPEPLPARHARSQSRRRPPYHQAAALAVGQPPPSPPATPSVSACGGTSSLLLAFTHAARRRSGSGLYGGLTGPRCPPVGAGRWLQSPAVAPAGRTGCRG